MKGRRRRISIVYKRPTTLQDGSEIRSFNSLAEVLDFVFLSQRSVSLLVVENGAGNYWETRVCRLTLRMEEERLYYEKREMLSGKLLEEYKEPFHLLAEYLEMLLEVDHQIQLEHVRCFRGRADGSISSVNDDLDAEEEV